MKIKMVPINIILDEDTSDKEYFAFFDKDVREKCLKQSIPDYIACNRASGTTPEETLNNLLEIVKKNKDRIIDNYDSVIKMIEINQKNLSNEGKEEQRKTITIDVEQTNLLLFGDAAYLYIPCVAGIECDDNPNWEIIDYRDESKSAVELSIKELIGKGENEKEALENLLAMVSKYRKSINECADIIESEIKKKLEDYTED